MGLYSILSAVEGWLGAKDLRWHSDQLQYSLIAVPPEMLRSHRTLTLAQHEKQLPKRRLRRRAAKRVGRELTRILIQSELAAGDVEHGLELLREDALAARAFSPA